MGGDIVYDILIAEDERRIRSGLKQYIPWEDMSFRIVAEAENGQEALELFELQRPDVILTDIRMSNMDGLALMKAIRQRCTYTRFVVLSGYNDFEYAREAILYGVSAYLLKPTKTFEIKQVFQKLKLELDQTSSKEGLSHRGMERASSGNHNSLTQALQYIESNYTNRINLKDAADKAFMSPTYFSKYFKEQVGKSFIEYVTELRLKKSKFLLRNTDYKIIDIAMMVGYEDFRHFCKIFKAKEGVSPTMYREHNEL